MVAQGGLLEVEQALEVEADGVREVLDELDGLGDTNVHNKITYLLESFDERHLGCDLLGIEAYIFQSIYR